jgi:lysozyme family protein
MSFNDAFARTVNVEGGYSDNPNDRGGPTKFGITQAVARGHGYAGDMRDLPIATAQAIYRSEYWDALTLTPIDARAPEIAAELFDIAVNCGVSVAGGFLQTALNAFNRGQKDYGDMPVDGSLGPTTLRAFKAFLDLRGQEGVLVLGRALNVQKGARYLALAKSRPADEDFEFGWFLHRVA